MATFSVDAKPYAFGFPLDETALLVIDMQRDFLLPGGFGEIEGADLTAVQAAIEPARKLLEACRAAGLAVFHTREGQLPDMSDCPSSKTHRPAVAPGTQYTTGIGDKGKMGRMLIRGEYGHDFVDELQAAPSETVIDKPGKGAFWQTELHYKLKARGITHLIICGVTTECCVTTTLREANDRGFECCAVIEATSGYNDTVFKDVSLNMLHWSQGLFGFVAHLQPLLDVLRPLSGRHLSSAAQTPPQTPPEWDGDLRISSLQAAYRNGLSPVKVVEAIYSKIEAYNEVNPGAWIYLVPLEDALAAARDLAAKFPDRTALPPLYGVPYTVKDSIDVAGLATTTACPPLSHIATVSAPIHDSVLREGALFIGKANLDQLATGLTGQRSPYGAPSSVFHRSFISGGSSSGSAVLVGARLCSFSLATDTAGSGRVPAAFNGVVGFKPTRGIVPFVGVTPACLSLDCIAIMAATVNDARTVWRAIDGFTTADPYAKRPELRYYSRHVNSIGPAASHFRFGIPPPEALAACSPPYRRCFDETVTRLQQLGGRLHPVDWTPFRAAGALLYDGSFVLERLASIPDLPGNGDGADAATFLARHRADLHPVILDVFDAALARNTSAAEVFRDLQTQAALTATVRNTVFCQAAGGVDVLVVPTAPTHFTVAEVAAEPVRRNSLLGTFTHAGNVLDLCGVACPAGKLRAGELVDGEEGELPFGVTFLGGSLTDADVLKIAARFEEAVRADGVFEGIPLTWMSHAGVEELDADVVVDR